MRFQNIPGRKTMGMFLFLLSSILYYELGSPFIDMNKLHTAKEKLLKENVFWDVLF